VINYRALYAAGAVSLAALAPMAAKAADMPQYTPPPVVTAVPLWDWSGGYVGLNAGYGWGTNGGASMSFLDPGGTWFGPCLAAGACAAGISYDNDGFVGGAQAGWNWQFDQFVLGVEADIQYSDMNGGGLIATAVAPFAVSTFNSTSDIDWLGTLRARAGFAFDRALIYATGGLAYGGVKDSFRWGFPALGQVYWGGGNNTEWGWTAGGGFEYAMTDNVIVGAEILYFDLGSTSVVGTPGPLFVPLPPVGTSLTANYDHDGVIARARISYKF
jgi:outer membrane immunogenic protein